MSEDLAVHARNLRRAHHEGVGLHGIDLDVHPGTVVALVGSDPAPTASLVRALDGRDPRVEGTLLVSGDRELIGSEVTRSGLGAVATRVLVRSPVDRRLRRIERAVDRMVPLLLLVDPLRDLDDADRERLSARLRAAARDHGVAVVLSACNPEHAAEIADRIDVLVDGRIDASIDIDHPSP